MYIQSLDSIDHPYILDVLFSYYTGIHGNNEADKDANSVLVLVL